MKHYIKKGSISTLFYLSYNKGTFIQVRLYETGVFTFLSKSTKTNCQPFSKNSEVTAGYIESVEAEDCIDCMTQ